MKKPLAKIIFNLAHKRLDDRTVYVVEPSEFEVQKIRVDCKDLGSFYTSFSDTEEYYDSAKGEYAYKAVKEWNFTSLHGLFDDFPEISMEDGLKFLKGL